jgi:hypothetical protein
MINVIFSIILAGSQMLASPTAIQTMMIAEGYMNAGQIELEPSIRLWLLMN